MVWMEKPSTKSLMDFMVVKTMTTETKKLQFTKYEDEVLNLHGDCYCLRLPS